MKDNNITIVIDPGHGGENLGGVFGHYTEKEMNLQTAIHMKNRLEQYDGITVYLTHENTTDDDMSLTNRAKFAASVNADFLFSLHYNKSEDNRLYGAEVWTSAFDNYYVEGTQFASIEMEALTGLGLYDRGIKTRLNNKGSDYYGIIKHCVEYKIPSVIIEHCHMDQINDSRYLLDENIYKVFGELDADCVAKYFKLKSESLNLDFSSYERKEIPFPENVMAPDTTEPEQAEIVVYDTNESEITIKITAYDSNSRLLYYDYSIDNGMTYSSLQAWNSGSTEDENTLYFYIPLAYDKGETLTCRVYNLYGLYSTTNTIELPQIKEHEVVTQVEEDLSDTAEEYIETIQLKPINSNAYQYSNLIFSVVVLFSIFFLIFCTVYLCTLSKRKKKRKHKKRR